MKEKTVVGIVASPRKMGNSELFIKELYLQLPGTWKLRLIRLTELDIRPCTACYRCTYGDMRCHLPDDFDPAVDAIAAADACVVAAPAYLLGANASLKRLQDRGLGYNRVLDALTGKPAVGVALAGIKGFEGRTKLDVDSFIRTAKLDHRGSEVLYGALPGEVLTEDGKALAKRLAGQLLNGAPVDKDAAAGPACPTCGGDTFRFLPEGGVRCMLCSSSATPEWREDRLQIVAMPGQQQFSRGKEWSRSHAGWLRSKKEGFLDKRAELKALATDYADIGEWVRPGRGL